MNHLQKKCLVASAGFHSLLIGVLVFGAAFFVPSKPDAPSVKIKVFRDSDVSEAPTTGGTPNARPAPIPIAPPTLNPVTAPARQVEPTKPPETHFTEEPAAINQPKPPKTKAKPPVKPKHETPEPPDDPEPEVTTRTTPKSEHQIVIDKGSLKPVSRRNTHSKPTTKPAATEDHSEDDAAAAEQEAQDRYARQARAAALSRAAEIGRLARNLNGDPSKSTEVGVTGPGGPDAANTNYRDIVETIYRGAWSRPASTTDKDAKVDVSVTIARDGRVIARRIVKRSGNADMDRSIERALDSVRFIQEFTANMKGPDRTFTITFDLKQIYDEN
jgi:colicin import membrane protein